MAVAPSFSNEEAACAMGQQNVDSRERQQRLTLFAKTHLTPVWRFLRRLGLSPEDAEDVSQEVFITAVAKFDTIYPGQERRFLYGIALRRASRKRRSMKSFTDRAVVLDIETCISDAPGSDEIVVRRQALELLDVILSQMSEELRTTFILYELEEMTVPEIATVVDAPIGTIASRLRRAREHFQRTSRQIKQTRDP